MEEKEWWAAAPDDPTPERDEPTCETCGHWVEAPEYFDVGVCRHRRALAIAENLRLGCGDTTPDQEAATITRYDYYCDSWEEADD